MLFLPLVTYKIIIAQPTVIFQFSYLVLLYREMCGQGGDVYLKPPPGPSFAQKLVNTTGKVSNDLHCVHW